MEHNVMVEVLKFVVLGVVIAYLLSVFIASKFKREQKFIKKMFSSKTTTQTSPQAPIETSSTIPCDDLALIATISAAIQHHKNKDD